MKYTDERNLLFERFCRMAVAEKGADLSRLLTLFIAENASYTEFISRHAILFIKTAEAARKHPECLKTGN